MSDCLMVDKFIISVCLISGNEFEGKMMPGMTFTIEPILCIGRNTFKILADQWTAVTKDNSRSAQFEHTILITKNGCEILTLPPETV